MRRSSSGPRAWSGRWSRRTGGARPWPSSCPRPNCQPRTRLERLRRRRPVAGCRPAPAVRGGARRDPTPSRCAARTDRSRATHELVWIVDWPLLAWAHDEERWDPHNHPFTAPAGEFDPADPGGARAKAYDVVWNGWEIGGGSIRISDPGLQRRVFDAIGIDDDAGPGSVWIPPCGPRPRRPAPRRDRLRS